MIENRKVLVVGGGRVGQRKVDLLLDAGARVTLVCPTCVGELVELADSGRIRLEPRPFAGSDVSGCSLVFACTDDKHVNRGILEASKAAGIPCCCADGNWPDGDFVTPAIIRAGDVLIAVSTSGRSCRQSRLIKDNLRKHLDSIESSDLFVLGTSHDYLLSDERAPYHLLLRERDEIGDMIRQVWGVHEFFILNTCNRIEIVAAISREAGTSGILRRLLRFDQLRPDLYYMKHGFEAFEHVCRVTAGLDSQTPGEYHVVSQIKDAVDEASARGWSGSIIRELCDAALHVSKDIRRETEPLLEVVEIEDVALRYLDGVPPGLSGRKALVIGTGVVGQGLVAGLLKRNCRCLWLYHRNAPHLDQALAPFVEVAQLGALARALPQADVVFSALDAPEPVVTRAEHFEALNPAGAVLVDLGLPRNIDRALDACGPQVRVADLDALKQWVRANDETRGLVDETCKRVMHEHRDIYERIRCSIQGEAPQQAV
jgi:glutamyl-tRNA reductase